MKIAGYLRTSLLEWPGKISSVLFTPGCNFRCPFCHNADLARNVGLQEISEQSILKDLKSRKKWIDGITITGGEPTLQPDLPEFMAKLKKMSFGVMVETNGSLPETLARIMNYESRIMDYLSLDFKTRFEDYSKVVRNKHVDVRDWQKSLQLMIASKLPFEIRTTIVPTIHNQEVLTEMAQELNSQLVNSLNKSILPIWYWQSFVPRNCLDSKFNKIKPYTRIELEDFLKRVKKFSPGIKIKLR